MTKSSALHAKKLFQGTFTEFSLTPNLDYFTPTFSKVPVEKYGKTPNFSGKQHFYSYFQNPSENSVLVSYDK